MENDTIVLDTPDGQVAVKVVALYEVDDIDYIAVVPEMMMDKDEAEVLIYRYKELDDGAELLDLTDEEFESAKEALEIILSEDEEEDPEDESSSDLA